jgi:hypothetical protein
MVADLYTTTCQEVCELVGALLQLGKACTLISAYYGIPAGHFIGNKLVHIGNIEMFIHVSIPSYS